MFYSQRVWIGYNIELDRSIFCDLGIGATPKLFLHAWFLNQNPNIERVKKFTGKDKQIGLFAKDMKKKKRRKSVKLATSLFHYMKKTISPAQISLENKALC